MHLRSITSPGSPMFTSTRDHSLKIPFWQSVVQGMAPDGGLLVPKSIPPLPRNFFKNKKALAELSVSDISTILHRLFIPRGAISDRELSSMMKKAHNFALPLEVLDASTWVLRIDRGPTASFKDIAARSLAELMEAYCAKHTTSINLVVATSGDTGVAIADAFGGSKRVSVTILYPHGGVSEVQEKQMLDVDERYSNEQSLPVRGNFDVCQDIAKTLQAARDSVAGMSKELHSLVAPLHLSSANSINIWRLIPQMTQYVAAYTALVRSGRVRAGEEIVFAIPTGNVGHLMAGVYARELGLPVKRFIVGTNANNVVANVVGSGVIKHREFTTTSSPSMDILDPSNLERLLAFAAQKVGQRSPIDFVAMKRDIKTLERSRAGISLTTYGVSPAALDYLQSLIWAEDVETDEEVYAMMERATRLSRRVLEPHGTTGLIATIRARVKGGIAPASQVVIFETAHPDKFPDALAEAHLERAPHYQHPRLAKLARRKLTSFKKPAPLSPDPLAVAKKIAAIAIT